jgi:hypothetical protein
VGFSDAALSGAGDHHHRCDQQGGRDHAENREELPGEINGRIKFSPQESDQILDAAAEIPTATPGTRCQYLGIPQMDQSAYDIDCHLTDAR